MHSIIQRTKDCQRPGGQTIVRAVKRKGGQAEHGMSGFCVDNNDRNTQGPECGEEKQ